jgi:hypothetical protein
VQQISKRNNSNKNKSDSYHENNIMEFVKNDFEKHLLDYKFAY